jgi:hypothetical protein
MKAATMLTAFEIQSFAARCLRLANTSLDRRVAAELIQMAEELTAMAEKVSSKTFRPLNQETDR